MSVEQETHTHIDGETHDVNRKSKTSTWSCSTSPIFNLCLAPRNSAMQFPIPDFIYHGKAHLFFFRIYTTASSLYLKVSQPGPLDLPMAASFPESSAQRHVTSARSDVPTMSAPSSRGGLRKTRDRCRRVDRCQNLPLGWRARWEEQTPW